MPRQKRYVIEGEWTGYRASQRRLAHRTVHSPSERHLRAWVERTHAIRFTDGTALVLSVRDCKPREKVEVLDGYGRLIRDCARLDVTSVDALQKAERGRP